LGNASRVDGFRAVTLAACPVSGAHTAGTGTRLPHRVRRPAAPPSEVAPAETHPEGDSPLALPVTIAPDSPTDAALHSTQTDTAAPIPCASGALLGLPQNPTVAESNRRTLGTDDEKAFAEHLVASQNCCR
jgi:hypothetical protein